MVVLLLCGMRYPAKKVRLCFSLFYSINILHTLEKGSVRNTRKGESMCNSDGTILLQPSNNAEQQVQCLQQQTEKDTTRSATKILFECVQCFRQKSLYCDACPLRSRLGGRLETMRLQSPLLQHLPLETHSAVRCGVCGRKFNRGHTLLCGDQRWWRECARAVPTKMSMSKASPDEGEQERHTERALCGQPHPPMLSSLIYYLLIILGVSFLTQGFQPFVPKTSIRRHASICLHANNDTEGLPVW